MPKMVLFLKHISIEGPGTVGDFFENRSQPIKVLELDQGDELPEDLSSVDAVVSLGGPMNAYEEDKHPFLRQEHAFLKNVLNNEIPLLGICLGSQLIAKALGAEVKKAPQKEIGFSSVELTKEGQDDPLFQGIPADLDVFQWHEDTFDLPGQATLLAKSEACAHQAYRYRNNVYGLQFHVEITDYHIKKWCDKYITKYSEGFEMKKQMLEDYQEKQDEFYKNAQIIYTNFLNIIESRRAAV